MKTAIYIEDGTVQLVITPETEWEKKAVGMFTDNEVEAQIFEGSFYDCRGGWVRQNPDIFDRNNSIYPMPHDRRDNSIILRAELKGKT